MGIIAIKCPSCGADVSLDESREFGFCTYCGTKVMQDKLIVEHRGNVKVDNSEELKNLYQAARNARETNDSETAIKHYERISVLDPNSWEAMFYLVVLKTENITNAQIASAASSIANCVPKVFELISENVADDQEKKNAIEIVVNECFASAAWLTQASHNFHKSVTKGNAVRGLTGGVIGAVSALSYSGEQINEDQNRCYHAANIMVVCSTIIPACFDIDDEFIKEQEIFCLKSALKFDAEFKEMHSCHIFNNEFIGKLQNKLKTYDSSYVPEKSVDQKDGCYVATAVYGSYDCPQVWTLRRFRDYSLAKTWHGRAFIRTYYAISPTLVKWFGDTVWFKKMWKGKLDKMIEKLHSEGYEDTPYNDIKW